MHIHDNNNVKRGGTEKKKCATLCESETQKGHIHILIWMMKNPFSIELARHLHLNTNIWVSFFCMRFRLFIPFIPRRFHKARSAHVRAVRKILARHTQWKLNVRNEQKSFSVQMLSKMPFPCRCTRRTFIRNSKLSSSKYWLKSVVSLEKKARQIKLKRK